MALIKPLSDDYPFSSNLIYFLICKMGAGKYYDNWTLICKAILLQDCSTSGKLDKTAEVLSKNVKTPIQYIKEEYLLPYLKRHLKRKLKYYAMVKHVLSKMVETNEEMARIISKYLLMEIKAITYIASKLVKYQTASYPYNTLLVLDDAAESPLFKNDNSELCRLLTKTRHYNLTCIIAVQTLRFVHLNVKRLTTDIICYSGFSKEDFMSMLQQTPNNITLTPTRMMSQYHILSQATKLTIINVRKLTK